MILFKRNELRKETTKRHLVKNHDLSKWDIIVNCLLIFQLHSPEKKKLKIRKTFKKIVVTLWLRKKH